MSAPEFSRTIDVRRAEGKAMRLEASEAERAALAERFGIVRIDRLEANVVLSRDETAMTVVGTLNANIVQQCAVSAEELPVQIEEPLALRFVPARTDYQPDEEIELDADDLDEIEYQGSTVDVGEAAAQTLALAIDPFLTGPAAEEARKRAGITKPEANSPFAALSGLEKRG